MDRFCRIIDTINEWTGKMVSLLFIPMAIIAAYEVVMRYVFDRPTIWVWEINTGMMALIIFLGAGYALLHGSHVKIELLTGRFSKKTRTAVDIATSSVFFFGIIVLLWQGVERALEAVAMRETSMTIFASPIYLLRVMLPVGVFLLMLQGVSKLCTDILTLIRRQPKLEHNDSKMAD